VTAVDVSNSIFTAGKVHTNRVRVSQHRPLVYSPTDLHRRSDSTNNDRLKRVGVTGHVVRGDGIRRESIFKIDIMYVYD